MAVLTFLVPAGCHRQTIEEKETRPDIVWPKAPEIPRIQFINSISKPEDLHIKEGLFKRFFSYLSGKTEMSIATPYGIETDAAGRMYVVDTYLRIVHVYDRHGKRFHTFPKDNEFLMSPIDIAIDNENGNIYVTDSKQGVVKIFKGQGKTYVSEIGKGVLERPTGIAVNEKTSELLVVDTLSANILRYDLKSLHLKGFIGGTGTVEGKLHYPTNICVAKDGTIIVSDSLNFSIQMLTPKGEFLRRFGSVGVNSGHFTRPKGVASDSDGNMYVVDALFDNVQMFDREGRLLMAFGGHGADFGEFWLPTGIYIDENDMIYISDTYNKRVQVFQYLKYQESGVRDRMSGIRGQVSGSRK